MNGFKRGGALLLTLGLSLTLLAGCGRKEAGVTFSACVGTDVESLDPIYAEDVSGQTVLVHLYENLMRIAPDGAGGTTVVGGMAKSVDVEENLDGTVTYTFRLHSAQWSDGKKVTAENFVYAWRRLAHPASYSPYAELLSVVCGYEEARAEANMELLQVTAKNETTLEVVLDGNYDWFLTEVCTSPATMPLRKDIVQQLKAAAEEKNLLSAAEGIVSTGRWWSDPVSLVTNGPYEVVAYEFGKELVTVASERYHGDLEGPAELTFLFTDTAEKAWSLYEKGDVDIVWPLTEERLSELSAEEAWNGVPELSTHAVLFNCDLLQDSLVRQAMTLVIDRHALAEKAGTTAFAAEGLVPPGVPDDDSKDFRTCKGPLLDNDPETYYDRCGQALQLLGEAGYDRGADLGEMEYLYVEEGNNGSVARALCTMWQTGLGIAISPRGVTNQELWAALRSGEYSVAGVDLHAVGNDAECFLMQWTTESPDNVVRYANSAYDTLMAIIATAPDGTARLGCLHDAEELLIGDYAIAPLYTGETAWELREPLAGVVRDARGWFSFAGVYAEENEK